MFKPTPFYFSCVTAYNTDCKYIQIADTEYQNQRDGRYKILAEDNMCSGRQAYRHDSTNNYIYFLELGDGWRGWMIGTSLCVNKVRYRNQSSV